MFVASVNEVFYQVNECKHSVRFANQAAQACLGGPRKGFADPGNCKAYIGNTRSQAIEALRKDLRDQILARDPSWDVSAFSFTMCLDEVDEHGGFWAHGGYRGSKMKIHEFNEGWE